MKKTVLGLIILISFIHFAYAAELDITNLNWNIDPIKERIKIHYTLEVNKNSVIDKKHPIYIFISYITDSSNDARPWKRPLNSNVDANGNGIRNEKRDSIITSIGKHVAYFYWNNEGLSKNDILHPNFKLRVHAKEMVLVPAGQYRLGNDNANCEVDGVAKLNAFYAMKYPVTVEEYAVCLNEIEKTDTGPDEHHYKYNSKMALPACGIMRRGSLGSYNYIVTPDREHSPVVYVTWFNACDYARWSGLRLLTEAEWEVVARGKDARRYSWGDSPDPNGTICNMFDDGVSYSSCVYQYEEAWEKSGLSTPFGAKELTGNVWEWVDTYWYDYNPGIYDSSKSRTSYKNTSNRVIRGGDWGTGVQWQRAAARNNDITPFSRNYGIGFRCAKDRQ